MLALPIPVHPGAVHRVLRVRTHPWGLTGGEGVEKVLTGTAPLELVFPVFSLPELVFRSPPRWEESGRDAPTAAHPPTPVLGEVLQVEAEVGFLIVQPRHAWMELRFAEFCQFWGGKRRPLPPTGRSGASADLPAAVQRLAALSAATAGAIFGPKTAHFQAFWDFWRTKLGRHKLKAVQKHLF